MYKVDCILFDCMETLIDIKEYPDLRLYAAWAYHGSNCEDLWDSFEIFLKDYEIAKSFLDEEYKNHQEYNIFDRFKFMIDKRFGKKKEKFRKDIIEKISFNYWKNYKNNCYVRLEVKELLKRLEKEYSLAVVSNFMKEKGVEELLKENDIIDYFDFVVTSIKTGWRKPNKIIFQEAIKKANISLDKILFVGDNYKCDYEGSRRIGLNSILLDRNNKYLDLNLDNRINKIEEIESFLSIEKKTGGK